jgi:hypothetical protein
MKLIRNRGRAPYDVNDDDYNRWVRHLAETSKSEIIWAAAEGGYLCADEAIQRKLPQAVTT